jgi:hypothetical protein
LRSVISRRIDPWLPLTAVCPSFAGRRRVERRAGSESG